MMQISKFLETVFLVFPLVRVIYEGYPKFLVFTKPLPLRYSEIHLLSPDGVTRGLMEVTAGRAPSPGLMADGRHPHICINNGGRP